MFGIMGNFGYYLELDSKKVGFKRINSIGKELHYPITLRYTY